MKAKLIAAAVLFGAGFILGIWTAHRFARPAASARIGLPPVLRVAAQSQPVKVWQHTVRTSAYIGDPTARTDGRLKATHDAAKGEWSFGDDRLSFTFRDATGKGTYTVSQQYAGRITIEQGRGGAIKDVRPELWEVVKGEATRQLPVAAWETDVMRPTGESLAAVEQSVGVGASVGGWRDVSPCITYSLFRVARLRLPSLMADAGSRVGAGVQARIWKPFHAGGFATWDLNDHYTQAVRITATANF